MQVISVKSAKFTSLKFFMSIVYHHKLHLKSDMISNPFIHQYMNLYTYIHPQHMWLMSVSYIYDVTNILNFNLLLTRQYNGFVIIKIISLHALVYKPKIKSIHKILIKISQIYRVIQKAGIKA